MKSSPCKDCPDRNIGCHSVCEKYLSWSKKHEEEKEVIRKAKAEELMYLSHVGRMKEALRRKKR